VLPSELVRVRRRGDELFLTSVKATERAEVERIAGDILQILASSLGQSADEVAESLAVVERSPGHEKVWAGLKKLALDDSEFGTPIEVDAQSLRLRVFQLASQQRKEATPEHPFSREEVLTRVASELGIVPEVVLEGLFSDLKGAARLSKCSALTPEALVERYELAQIQGILLRAVRLRVALTCSGPEQARALFQKLKFRQLLYRLEAREDGTYELEIEGPFSLFDSVTKYGLKLALIVPVLMECRRAELSADVLWGKERRPLQFKTTLGGSPGIELGSPRSEVALLKDALEKQKSDFSVTTAHEMFNIPGIGICIPDLRLSRNGQDHVYVEVLGYWSRDAVWKRVEWAQNGAPERVIFAVSSKLRVSEEVLPKETGAALYVYKGTMSAPALLRQVEELLLSS
jgi:predicted nuclease of restriction endonuclease-like RecB superfamily